MKGREYNIKGRELCRVEAEERDARTSLTLAPCNFMFSLRDTTVKLRFTEHKKHTQYHFFVEG